MILNAIPEITPHFRWHHMISYVVKTSIISWNILKRTYIYIYLPKVLYIAASICIHACPNVQGYPHEPSSMLQHELVAHCSPAIPWLTFSHHCWFVCCSCIAFFSSRNVKLQDHFIHLGWCPRRRNALEECGIAACLVVFSTEQQNRILSESSTLQGTSGFVMPGSLVAKRPWNHPKKASEPWYYHHQLDQN